MLRPLEQHIYGGALFRPAPVLIPSADQRQLAVLTYWGLSSPPEALSGLPEDPAEALQFLHHQIFQEHEGRVGAEALVLSFRGRTIQWAGCGQPSLFLCRAGRTLALHQPTDLNFDAAPEPFAAPLPSALIGLEEAQPVSSRGEFQWQADMSLLLLSRSWVPASALPHLEDKNECTQALANDSEDMPFWWCKLGPA